MFASETACMIRNLTELRVLSVNSERRGKILGADYASIAPNVCVKTCFKRAG